jgi:uncharacterized protein (DUF1015 family)
MLALAAQTGPVFMTYRASPEVDQVIERATIAPPVVDFPAIDGVHHTIWQITGADRDALVQAFAHIPALYIADGHHRAASAARARTAIAERGAAASRGSLGDGADYRTMLGVAFPDNQVQILPYNRVVKDLGGLAPDAFLRALREAFEIDTGPATPAHRGEIAMYLGGEWYTLTPKARAAAARPEPGRGDDPIGSLDVSILQERLLAPILKIADIRTDKRIDFVGGARGTRELERLVDSGKAAVGFSLFPVGVGDLMTVSDAGEIMPPKSTWFEPKLRDGLLIHMI